MQTDRLAWRWGSTLGGMGALQGSGRKAQGGQSPSFPSDWTL